MLSSCMKYILAKKEPSLFDLILKEYSAFYKKKFGDDITDFLKSKYSQLLTSERTQLIIERIEGNKYPVGFFNYGFVNEWAEIRQFYLRKTNFNKNNFFDVWLNIVSEFDASIKKMVFQSRLFTIPPYKSIENFNLGFEKYTRGDYYLDLKKSSFYKKNYPQINLEKLKDINISKLSFLFYLCYKNTLDYNIIPYYQNMDYAKALIESIFNNTYGVFLEDISFLIKKKDKTIGLILSSKLHKNSILLIGFNLLEKYRTKKIKSYILDKFIKLSAQKKYNKIYISLTETKSSDLDIFKEKGFKKKNNYSLFLKKLNIKQNEYEKNKNKKLKNNVKNFNPKKLF